MPLVICARTRMIISQAWPLGYYNPSIKCGHVQSVFKNKGGMNVFHCSREIGVNIGKDDKNGVVNSESLWRKQLGLIRKMRRRTKAAAEVI